MIYSFRQGRSDKAFPGRGSCDIASRHLYNRSNPHHGFRRCFQSRWLVFQSPQGALERLSNPSQGGQLVPRHDSFARLETLGVGLSFGCLVTFFGSDPR
jgi:hypothetical protein